MEIENKKLLQHAIEWAKEAGEIQLSYFRGNNLDITTKYNEHDIVTAADKACEQHLLSRIAKYYPDHTILGEESGEHQGSSLYRWVIDPLDGTTNFSEGLPIFAVSIGIEYRGETIVGVVYAPYLQELYTAIKGEGAYCNEMRIHVSEKKRLDHSVLATGFPVDKDRNPDNNLDNVARILPHIRGLRRMGSAAYDLCCVAAGHLDGYWEMNISPWDVCAGSLIVTEAGGIVCPFRNDRRISIAAAPPALLEQFFEMLNNPEKE